MNLKDSERYQKEHNKVPTGTIIASPEPIPLNYVFILAGQRFVVSKEISRKEFQKRHMENLNTRDAAYGNIDIENSKATIDPVDSLFPSEDQKYFYECKVIL